jgi:hypothetical protein
MSTLYPPMSKSQPVNIGENSQGQYESLILALRKILRVSHAEMLERLAVEKKARAYKTRPSSSRVSRYKD